MFGRRKIRGGSIVARERIENFVIRISEIVSYLEVEKGIIVCWT